MNNALHVICLTWDNKFFKDLQCVDKDILSMHKARCPSDVEALLGELPAADALLIDTDTFHLDRASGLKALLAGEDRMVRVLATSRAEVPIDTRLMTPESPCMILRKAQDLEIILRDLIALIDSNTHITQANTRPERPETKAIHKFDTADTKIAHEPLLSFDAMIHTERLATSGLLGRNVGHELNNINSVLLSSTAELRRHLSRHGLESSKDIIDDLEWVSGNMRRFAEYLLEFGQVSQGHGIEQMIDVQSVLRDVLEMLSDVGRTKYVSLRTSFVNEAIFVRIGRHQIEQLFISLITNAADAVLGYSDSSRVVEIQVTHMHEEQRVVCSIRDTGPGIDPQMQQQLFNPFYSTKKAGSGTGLGLPVARHIVESVGGVLRLESEVGQGTTFDIELPVEMAAEVTSPVHVAVQLASP